MQHVQQHIHPAPAESSSAAAGRDHEAPSQKDHALIQDAFDRVVRIMENSNLGSARTQDAGNQPKSFFASTNAREEDTRHGSVTFAVMRALNSLNNALHPPAQQGTEENEEPQSSPESATTAATETGPGDSAEPSAESGVDSGASKKEKAKKAKAEAKAKAKAEKDKVKTQRATKKTEKMILHNENKYANKEIRARKKEEKWRARKEAEEQKKLSFREERQEHGKAVGGTTTLSYSDLPSLPTLIASAAAAAPGDGDDEAVAGPSQPQLGVGGDGASSPMPLRARVRNLAAISPLYPPAGKTPPGTVSFPSNSANYKFASGMTSPVDEAAARNDWLIQRAGLQEQMTTL